MSMSNTLMRTGRGLAVTALSAVAMVSAAMAGPDLGRPATPDQVAAWDISVAPNGDTLPPGGGTAKDGLAVYDEKCASCHGPGAAGGDGMADPMVGGIGTLASDSPLKTVGSYWPHATTLFDYVRRAMPFDAPLSLTDDEVYAVSAYILAENGIIGADTEMNADNLPKVKMPNRDGFISFWPPKE